jgi:polysaccharide export outer membrane protein
MPSQLSSRSFAALTIILSLSACGGSNFRPETASSVTVATTLSAPSIADQLLASTRQTVMGPGDRLDFKVLGLPELDRTIRVDDDGTANFPLIGTVQVAGVPLSTLRSDVTTRLGARYLQHPEVTLGIAESVNQRFVIDGGVRTPGVYPVLGNATLIQSVAQAQGLSDTARAAEVVVFRTVNGQRMAAIFNLDDIRGGRSPDPQIYANDQVIVGSDANRVLLTQLVSLSPIIGLFYQLVR